MKKKKIILITIISVILIAGIIWFFLKNKNFNQQEISMDTPINIVLDFYEPWLQSIQTENTDPYIEELNKTPILSKNLQKKISTANKSSDGIDPVLCQTTIPTKISARVVYENENESQILVLARDEGLDAQSVFTLKKQNEGWYIDDITCSPGEFGPEREFTFEKEGLLVKNVPEPYNSENWHLVFVENNELSLVPLSFNEESICVLSKKDENTCDPNRFQENTKAIIYGEMSETGTSVKKLEITK